MAVQNSIYITDGTTRTFPSTKHIATKQHVAVRGKRVFDSAWEYIEPEVFNLVNNSIVFLTAPATSIYSQIEIRVADDYDELASQPNDISAVAQYLTEIGVVADNIDSIVAASNGEYLTYGLPSTANCGDLSVDTLSGGIYRWNCDTSVWDLVGRSGSNISTVVPLGVNIVTGLPTVGANGEIIFNEADGYFYGYINGVWTQMISTPTTNDQVGIEVLADDPTTNNYEGRVIFNTTLNQLRKYVSGAWIQVVEPTTAAATVADGSLTTAAFAATIRPVEIFDTLPTTGNSVGRLVYLTTDGLLYRYTSSGFTTSIPTTSLTGTITSTQIGANQITTGALAVGAVTADTIAANAITSDKISSNSITTGMIQAGAIGATQIASNAITADKINAGAVTATKIAALSIDATKIVAGSIGADQIAANAITAGKIAAGAVSASNIAAGTITATQIAASTITSAQIASYAITSAKLDVNALAGHHASFDATKGTVDASPVLGAGQNSVVVSNGGLNTTCGVVGVGKNYGTVGEAKLAGSSSASVLGWGSTANTTGVRGVSKDYAAVEGVSNNGYGVQGVTSRSDGMWGISTPNKTYSGGGYFPFTGAHIAFGKGEYEIGDIVDAVGSELINVDQSYIEVSVSNSSKSKAVIGVVTTVNDDPENNLRKNPVLCNETVVKYGNVELLEYNTYKKEYTGFINYLVENKYKEIGINALGEGGINVCSEGGNIEIGDYICSSSIKGKGMKQDDDLLHNYTVAKALEAVDWSEESSNVKMIACTYHCG